MDLPFKTVAFPILGVPFLLSRKTSFETQKQTDPVFGKNDA